MMKLIYKKKRWLAGLLILAMCMAIPTSATTISDAEKKKAEAQKELNAINKEIAALEKKQSAVAEEIQSLDSELDALLVNLELLEYDLEIKEQELVQTQTDLEAAQEQEARQYEAMKLRIQYIYEEGDVDYMSMMLETQSLADFLTRSDFAQEIYQQDRAMMEEYQAIIEEVTETKARLEWEKEDLVTLQAEYEEEKASVETVLAEKEKQSKNFKTLLADAEKKAKAYKTTISQQNAQIKKLQEEAEKKNQSTGSSNSSSGNIVVSGNSSLGNQIANYAVQFVGNPYVYGGTSLTNGADCSGFTQSVFKQFGISLPRTSGQQAKAGAGVSYLEAQAGDLICYSGHVGIYIGNGKIVHASSAKTGIKISSATYRTILAVRRCY